jgi:S1-C subfamily serine protease
LPAEDAPVVVEPEPESSGGVLPKVVMGVIVFGALAGVAYWTFTQPAPPSSFTPRQSEAAPDGSAPGDTSRVASPEARAWDAAAANAKDAPTPEAPTPVAAISFPPPSNAPVGSIEEMVDRVMPAVVLIQTTGGRGSGFFVLRDTLITNQHVVQNDTYVTLKKSDGSTVTARVESRAPAFDIAILKVAQPAVTQPVIPMSTADSLKPGQEIIVIGSALGTLQNSVSRGVVSGLRTAGGATLVQTDAAINPGNSGGPMLDRNGNVIAITTMSYRNAEGLNFGVAIDHAKDLLEGRQANLGSARGLQDIESQSRGSETDRQQRQGEDQFRAQIGQLAEAAGRIDAGWTRYRQQCYTSPISGSYNRAWFAMLVPNGMPTNAGTGCIEYYRAMDSDIKKFKGLMQRAVDDARRAGVLPGTVREILGTNRLDFEWDR